MIGCIIPHSPFTYNSTAVATLLPYVIEGYFTGVKILEPNFHKLKLRIICIALPNEVYISKRFCTLCVGNVLTVR